MSQQFEGRVGGVEYNDANLFEKAANALGYRSGLGTNGHWALGTAVGVTFEDGTKVNGQVWCRGHSKKTFWLALDDGSYVLAYADSGHARSDNGRLGKVA